MSQVVLVKFKLKPWNEKTRLDRCEELKIRSNEVLETLKEEWVSCEACFLDEETKCIYYFMQAENFDKVKEIATNSNHPIDIDHTIKKSLSIEKVWPLKQLFHFESNSI